MTVQTMHSKNARSSKISQKYVEVRSFYSKHFPTDRHTFKLRIPFVGLVLSILALHFVISESEVRWYIQRELDDIARYCYIFVAAGIAYELYYGLNIGDRKQFTPWILLKFIETLIIFGTLIYILATSGPILKHRVGVIVYGFILLVCNGFVTYIVTAASWKQFHGMTTTSTPNPNDDEKINNSYDSV